MKKTKVPTIKEADRVLLGFLTNNRELLCKLYKCKSLAGVVKIYAEKGVFEKN